METIEKIKQQLADNPIIIYMKGSPKLPELRFFSSGVSSPDCMWSTFCICRHSAKPGYPC